MEKEEKDFNMFDWWKKVVLENYANFSGRARRAEFWWFNLVNFIVYMVCFLLIIVTTSIAPKSGLSLIPTVLMVVYILGTAIPSLAVAVRRLHDTGKSGLLILLPAIPFVGSIASIVLLVFIVLKAKRAPINTALTPRIQMMILIIRIIFSGFPARCRPQCRRFIPNNRRRRRNLTSRPNTSAGF